MIVYGRKKMGKKLKRFAVSLEEKLFNQFEQYVRLNRGGNRSQFIRDLIRKFLLQQT